MNATVFGATGAIGSLTVNELLANGHTVTAYARNPQKIQPGWGNSICVIIGELSDADAIDGTVEGAGAVVSALCPSLDRKATGLPLVDGTRHILDAMKRHRPRPEGPSKERHAGTRMATTLASRAAGCGGTR